MPYRRLPTTDLARLRALEKANQLSYKVRPEELAFSETSLITIRNFLPRFRNSVMNFNASRETQASRSREFIELSRRARLYLSHFIQVMNMAIARGEHKPGIRKFYGMDEKDDGVPKFSSDIELIEWGKRVIDGDQKRLMNGGSPMYNPSIALVKVNYEKFCDAHRHQKILQADTDRQQQLVASLRREADSIILQVWNEVELTYSHFDEEQKRERSMLYGVVYVYRKRERVKIAAMPMAHASEKVLYSDKTRKTQSHLFEE